MPTTPLLSPGVAWREEDFSGYAAEIATSVFAVVGQASKGKTGEVIDISGATDMVTKVGSPDPNFRDQALYALDNFFKVGRIARFVRVVGDDAEKALSPYVRDSDDTQDLFQFEAISEGVWAHDIYVEILEVDPLENEFDLVVKVTDPNDPTKQVQVERFDAVTLDPNAERFIEVVINEGLNGTLPSNYVTILMENYTAPIDPEEVTVQLGDVGTGTGGVQGNDGITPTDAQYQAALDLFADADSYDINILAAPGVTSITENAEKVREICQDKRGDCIGIIDPPKVNSIKPLDPATAISNIVAWRSGLNVTSSYTCTFWPWVKFFDSYNNRNVWQPPSGIVAARMAYTDQVSFPWYAPAGLNRGAINGALDIGYITNQEERDILYDRKVNINVIKREPGEGFVLWGQRTMQPKPTALDRINVRRLMLYLEKIVAGTVKYLVFEPNDPVMWDTFRSLVIPVFEAVKDGRGLEDYEVIMDENTVTGLARSRKEAPGLLKVVPVGSAEKIPLTFALYPAGAKFA